MGTVENRKSIRKLLSIMIMVALVIIMAPAPVNAATKPGKPKITKVVTSDENASTAKVTVTYKKVKRAKSYKLYNVISKSKWKYLKTVKASKKKKFSNKKKYKLKKQGKKYKVYRKFTTYKYKQLASSKKTKISFRGKYGKKYVLVVRAFNGKKAGAYSAKKIFTPKRPGPKYDQYETYVFFGSDSRRNDELWKSENGGVIRYDKSSHEGSTPKSDVIMLINVNRASNDFDIVSIYRDTALNTSSSGISFQKINQAYSEKGPKEACKVLERNLDIKIKGYAVSNFKGVADVIDDLCGMTGSAGIEVSGLTAVTTAEYRDKGSDAADIANNYINEMNNVYGLSTPHITKGIDKQHLSGLQAVAYARVRYTDGGDFKRAARQRLVLDQMIKKYNSLSSGDKIRLITDNISGIEVGFMDNNKESAHKRLANIILGVSKFKKTEVGFPFYKNGYDKDSALGYLVVPCDLSTNVTRLHNLVFREKWYAPNKTVKKYSDELVKKTGLNYNNRATSLDNQ